MGRRRRLASRRLGKRLAPAAPGGGERAEIAVCKGQHDEVRRGLAEILGRRGLLKSMPFPQQDVHALPRQRPHVTAA